MKDRYLILFAVLVGIFQITVLQFFSFAGVIPNLAMIIVIVVTIYLSEIEALRFSVYLAATLDILAGRGLGVYMVAFVLISFIIIKLGGTVFNDNVVTPILFIGVSTIFMFIYFSLIDYFSSGFVHGFIWSIKVLFINLIYNFLVGVPIYNFVINKTYRRRF